MLSSSTLCSKAPVFVLSFKMSRYWCHSFFVLQSVKQRRRMAMKKNRLKSFSFSFVLFAHTKAAASHNHIFSFHLLSFYFSIFSLLPHQGKVRLGFAIWISNARWFKIRHKSRKLCFWICCKRFVFLLIKTNPWLVAEERHHFIWYISCHFTLSVKVKVKL